VAEHITDLYRLTEDERIKLIGEAAAAGGTVGVFIDADRKKIGRYVTKVTRRYPTVQLIDQKAHPEVRKVVILRFGPKDKPN
jgi:hydrogenase maturation factor HypF (carbamoyltransferase family)